MSTHTRTSRVRRRARTRDAIATLALVTAIAAAFPVFGALSEPAVPDTTTTDKPGNDMPPPDWVKRFLEADAANP
jgi:hypothetical protein